ncbi:YdeI/OmpD-associated family protein [Rhodohalobacter sp. 614A]|uniref:YdeI/OmpD-associated family protein n=1 Tax=Rhodohalobacter sp. 614A TaxID=2908649 RepID=UPI001F3AE18F|nr:YdeI/OmpD-associated family protein [Rhodohalobacter sp. 614A]
MNSNVDKFLSKADKWREEMERLRQICLECGLTEELKWRKPCYTSQGNNIAIIQPFKDSCALMFFKGVLMKDNNNILEKPGENSRVARRLSFKRLEDIVEVESVIKSYIQEAVEIEKKGLKVPERENEEPDLPEELQEKLDENPQLKTAFEALTPGRQRGYTLYFSDAKQSRTRKRRVEKYIPKILDGKGLHDR